MREHDLDSWKEIAQHLGRTVRTVQRWERHCGLPVHRHRHRESSSVYAYKRELDVWWAGRRPEDPGMLPGAPVVPSECRRIAVLTFADLSRQSDQGPFCAGLTQELVRALAAYPEFQVVSPSSVSRVQAGPDESRFEAIRGRLDVEFVIDGSLLREADLLRISVRMIDPSRCDLVVWAEKYDRTASELLELQTQIALSIAERARVTLIAREALIARPTRRVQPQAYEAYLQGRWQMRWRTESSLRLALKHFKDAIGHDASDALGYSGLAESYAALSGNEFWAPRAGYPLAKAAAQTAIRLDATNSDARAALGLVRCLYDWNWPTADKEFREALVCNPSNANAYHWYGLALLSVGKLREGTAAIARAHTLDPLSPTITANLGRPLHCLRQYDKAAEQFRKAADLEPDLWLAFGFLAWTLTDAGQYAEAERAAAMAVDKSHGNASALITLADVRAARGDRLGATTLIDSVLKDKRIPYVSAFRVGRVFARLNDATAAFQWLDISRRDRSLGSTSFLLFDKALDSIRDTRKFRSYLAAVGLGDRSEGPSAFA